MFSPIAIQPALHFRIDGARKITVLQSDGGPLVGMELLQGFRMTMDVIVGGSVVIKALTP
jgi:hypothetical protein